MVPVVLPLLSGQADSGRRQAADKKAESYKKAYRAN
jgi:hypothetical protein